MMTVVSDILVRGAERPNFGACAQSQAESDEDGQDQQRAEAGEHRTEVERDLAIHTGAPIGNDDRIPAMTFH